ncbi:hypothetical protein [Moorena producens]|uniref:hypothetical protein n=1 Tax=Moorena producens TaxID=1155739 RepID=UPI001313D8C6|nr:hypothetical protein [Moorena producens]
MLYTLFDIGIRVGIVRIFFSCSLLPTPYSLLPAPCSLIPAPYSLLPAPYSLFPVPCSLCYSLLN